MKNPLLIAKAAISFARIVRDPNQLDVVFELVDAMAADPRGEQAFADNLVKPQVAQAAADEVRLPSLNLDRLAAMPPGSFGEVAGRFFRAHGLDPDALPRRQTNTKEEWLSAHLFETHDLWHVLTGFGPDVAGELGLQAFYAAQVEGLVALSILSAGLLNTLIFNPQDRRARLEAISRGYQMGRNSGLFVGADFGAMLHRPLDEVRQELGVVVRPELDAMARLPETTVQEAA